jgi:hypothetical protein
MTVVALSARDRDDPPGSEAGSGWWFALDRMVHRLTGWHLIEPCNCARCQVREHTGR